MCVVISFGRGEDNLGIDLLPCLCCAGKLAFDVHYELITNDIDRYRGVRELSETSALYLFTRARAPMIFDSRSHNIVVTDRRSLFDLFPIKFFS